MRRRRGATGGRASSPASLARARERARLPAARADALDAAPPVSRRVRDRPTPQPRHGDRPLHDALGAVPGPGPCSQGVRRCVGARRCSARPGTRTEDDTAAGRRIPPGTVGRGRHGSEPKSWSVAVPPCETRSTPYVGSVKVEAVRTCGSTDAAAVTPSASDRRNDRLRKIVAAHQHAEDVLTNPDMMISAGLADGGHPLAFAMGHFVTGGN